MKASLPWYDFPFVKEHTDYFWLAIRQELEISGLECPVQLDRITPYYQQWCDPDLIISQACGYDLVDPFEAQLKLLVTPVYDAPGCEGPYYRSFVVTHERLLNSLGTNLEGTRLSINSVNSFSGFYAIKSVLNSTASPFIEITVAGSHWESLMRIKRGESDIAAIDCVSYELIRRNAPRVLADIRILCVTAKAPAPPYVTARNNSNASRVRDALCNVIGNGELSELLISGYEVLLPSDYEQIRNFSLLPPYFKQARDWPRVAVQDPCHFGFKPIVDERVMTKQD